MTLTYFYYPLGYLLLRTPNPPSAESVYGMAHDYGARVIPYPVEEKPAIRQEIIDKEKQHGKTVMYGHKSWRQKQRGIWKNERDEVIRQILSYKNPRFNVRLDVSAAGV